MTTSSATDSGTPEEKKDPWYKDGLCFECTQCGNCCTGGPGFVWVEEDEIQAIADHLDKSIGEIRLMYTRPAKGRTSLNEYANGDCFFFDPEQRRCTIYSARPRQCRTWPFWNSVLASEADWKDIQRNCPGAGHGKLVTLEEIELLSAQVDV